ncbi:MAG: glycosyltransferase family 39 protein [Smithella sp.]
MIIDYWDKLFPRLKQNEYWQWVILVFIIIFSASIRIRLLNIPLERDEGEFAYMGQLILQGIPPYLSAYNMKLPGIYAVYALIMSVFGETIPGIHLGLIVANSAAIILLFILTRRLFSSNAALIAAGCYALLSIIPSFLGTSAHATQFIVPFVLEGVILLLKAVESEKYLTLFISGILFGLALTIKQHAVFFIVFAVFYFSVQLMSGSQRNWSRFLKGNLILVAGSALPLFLIIAAFLYKIDLFMKFWFWTFTYASQYVSIVPISEAPFIFKTIFLGVIDSSRLLWAIAGIGLTAPFWNEKARSIRLFLYSFFIFSFLSICPGFYFRNHYFITLMPAISIFAGIVTVSSMQWLTRKKFMKVFQFIPIMIIIMAMAIPVVKLRDFFFILTPVEACRYMYGLNPFPESVEIAEYIRKDSKIGDAIAVVGSEPQIFFYADRKSATGYIYTYSMMEPHPYAAQLQRNMIREIETARPKYLIMVNVYSSWLVRENSDRLIFKWAEKYFKENYVLIGLFHSTSDWTYERYWNEIPENIEPLPREIIFIGKRIIR